MVMLVKKGLFLLISIVIGIMAYHKNEEIIIPHDAIRMRIIANSNNISDLYAKKKLKEAIETDIYNLISDVNNIDDARLKIQNNLDYINKIVSSKTSDFNINYGFNYFPRKNYRGVIYPEGNYESLVITLGSGLGENWWCVLYPPLCLINENRNTNDVEYRSFIYDLLNN